MSDNEHNPNWNLRIVRQLERIADALEKYIELYGPKPVLLYPNKVAEVVPFESAGEKEKGAIGTSIRKVGREQQPCPTPSDSKPAPQEESKWIEFKGYMRGYTPKAIQVIIPNDTKQWFPRKQVVNIDDIDEDETNIPQFFKVTRWIANQKGIEHILEGRL